MDAPTLATTTPTIIDGSSPSPQPCPFSVYYLPKFPETWTAEDISYEAVLDLKASRGNKGFYHQLMSINGLTLFDLDAMDETWRRVNALSQTRKRPTNVTIALFFDPTRNIGVPNASLACEFSSSRGPKKPDFELVKYRRPETQESLL